MMKKVLIVEDSVFIVKAIKLLLEKNGLEVLSTADGNQAVNIVKEKAVDLVILDLMMPNVSGADVFKMLKQDEATKKTKIMILTAKTDALRWHPELSACDKFRPKPFDNSELVAEVKKLLGEN